MNVFNKRICKALLAVGSFILLLTNVSTLIAASAQVPENAANSSDFVVHGEVKDISRQESAAPGFEGVSRYHSVQIQVEEVFKGQIPDDTVTVHVGGAEGLHISTAASFAEGEEVVVMLEEHRGYLYMESGYASKFEVENSTTRITGPEQKNITVEKMKSIVQNTTGNTTATYTAQDRSNRKLEAEPLGKRTREDRKKSMVEKLVRFIAGLIPLDGVIPGGATAD